MGKGMGKEDPYWANWKPGEYFEEPGGKVGIEGLRDAITRAVEPHASLEQGWKKEDMVNKLCMAIFKTSEKDDRKKNSTRLHEFAHRARHPLVISTRSTTPR